MAAKGIYKEPERTLARVASVLRDRGLPGIPPRFDDRWRTHFPDRASTRRHR